MQIKWRFEDMTAAERRICDDLIDELSVVFGQDWMTLDRTRPPFWERVFSYWNTAMYIEKPRASPRPRRLARLLAKVGTLKVDCPTPVNKTENTTEPSITPPERRAGAPVYMIPILDPDTAQFTLLMLDGKCRRIPAHSFRFDAYMSPAQATVLATSAWNDHEMERIGEFNWERALYWARRRLVRRLAREEVERGLYDADLLPTVAQGEAEDFSVLLQYRPVEWESMTEIAVAIAALMAELDGH